MAKAAWETVILKQTVNATATVNSDPIDVSYDEQFSYKITIHSGTTPDITLGYQIIESGQGLKADVGGAKDTENGFTWVTPTTGGTPILSGFSSGSKANAFAPMVTKWLRFFVTGIGSNGSNVVVSVHIARQPKV